MGKDLFTDYPVQKEVQILFTCMSFWWSRLSSSAKRRPAPYWFPASRWLTARSGGGRAELGEFSGSSAPLWPSHRRRGQRCGWSPGTKWLKWHRKSGQWMSKIVESLFFFKHFGLVKCLGCMDVLGPEESGLARGVGVFTFVEKPVPGLRICSQPRGFAWRNSRLNAFVN